MTYGRIHLENFWYLHITIPLLIFFLRPLQCGRCADIISLCHTSSSFCPNYPAWVEKVHHVDQELWWRSTEFVGISPKRRSSTWRNEYFMLKVVDGGLKIKSRNYHLWPHVRGLGLTMDHIDCAFRMGAKIALPQKWCTFQEASQDQCFWTTRANLCHIAMQSRVANQ